MTIPAISLVVYNVTPLLIGPSEWVLITLIMYHMGEGTRMCPFPVTGNKHGRVTEPKDQQFSGHILDLIPKLEYRTLKFLCQKGKAMDFSVR